MPRYDNFICKVAKNLLALPIYLSDPPEPSVCVDTVCRQLKLFSKIEVDLWDVCFIDVVI